MVLLDLINTAASFMGTSGDEINIKRTDRCTVAKAKHNNEKYSVVQYDNGTTVETRSRKAR